MIYKSFFLYFSVCFLCSCTVRTDPGIGKKVGRIVNVSKQGLISKTWEATVIRGGLSDGSGVIGLPLEITIESEGLAMEAMKCMEDQAEVIILYRVEFISSLFRSEHLQPYFCEQIFRK